MGEISITKKAEIIRRYVGMYKSAFGEYPTVRDIANTYNLAESEAYAILVILVGKDNINTHTQVEWI